MNDNIKKLLIAAALGYGVTRITKSTVAGIGASTFVYLLWQRQTSPPPTMTRLPADLQTLSPTDLSRLQITSPEIVPSMTHSQNQQEQYAAVYPVSLPTQQQVMNWQRLIEQKRAQERWKQSHPFEQYDPNVYF